jgi:hypothetical protein
MLNQSPGSDVRALVFSAINVPGTPGRPPTFKSAPGRENAIIGSGVAVAKNNERISSVFGEIGVYIVRGGRVLDKVQVTV